MNAGTSLIKHYSIIIYTNKIKIRIFTNNRNIITTFTSRALIKGVSRKVGSLLFIWYFRILAVALSGNIYPHT
ncbi:hypothetical protein ATK78_2167 [Pedobacter metabolipauper]|uniref:Uncharacterized protein n=1 Tax=Pedobacter metabolipauper TaxID=425513 RepID=A0A4R6SVT7_9SPHI|nr:hypothetical protein ATK78_2167 [Pedobacter metabolipauper]